MKMLREGKLLLILLLLLVPNATHWVGGFPACKGVEIINNKHTDRQH